MIQLKIIEILKKNLSECSEIRSAILYGSFARQDANVNSDIDLAILIGKNFNEKKFTNQLRDILSEFNILEILHIQLRNKIAIYFENIPKIEIALLSKIEDIKRNYHGSGIPSDLIDTTILFDKTKSIKSFLSKLARNNKKQNIKPIINELINKFIYEFESCSYNHSRSDGYKFYYFYNIAFHIAIQLRYLADGKTDFYFLPKNFIVKNATEKEREEIYKLAGSTYLRDANDKKRKLIDFFINSLTKLN
jgi:predicted nucleotidyltransferase